MRRSSIIDQTFLNKKKEKKKKTQHYFVQEKFALSKIEFSSKQKSPPDNFIFKKNVHTQNRNLATETK
jgi:hypothetical protein